MMYVFYKLFHRVASLFSSQQQHNKLIFYSRIYSYSATWSMWTIYISHVIHWLGMSNCFHARKWMKIHEDKNYAVFFDQYGWEICSNCLDISFTCSLIVYLLVVKRNRFYNKDKPPKIRLTRTWQYRFSDRFLQVSYWYIYIHQQS